MKYDFDTFHDEIFNDLKMNKEYFERVYVVRNIIGKISLYFYKPSDFDCLKSKIANKFPEKYWFEYIDELRENSLVLKKLQEICIQLEDNIFYAERRNTRLNWFGNHKDNSQGILDGSKTKIITFYSYKGGVGRTTALVATALQLVRNGKIIVLVDFDLEAPGLATLFYSEEEAQMYSNVKGVTEFILQSNINKSMGINELEDFYFEINDTEIVGSEGGKLIIIPAGITAEEYANSYLEKMSRIDLNSDIYRSNESPIKKLFELISDKFAPDFIFVDSRTGINDIGGLTLTSFSDMGVLFFYGNQQNMFGLRIIVPVLKELGLKILLVNSPVPLNTTDREEEIDYYINTSYEIFCNSYYDLELIPERFDKSAEHYPINVPYNQEAVVLNHPTKIVKLLKAVHEDNGYLEISSYINRLNSIVLKPDQSSTYSKEIILEAMANIIPESNITGASEHEFANKNDLVKRFYPRKDYKFIFEHDRFLILGEKGMGKTALFLMLTHTDYAKVLAEYCGVNHEEFSTTEWFVGLENTIEFPTENNFRNLLDLTDVELKNYWLCLFIRCIYNKISWISNVNFPEINKILESEVASLKKFAMNIDLIEKLEAWLSYFQQECESRNIRITVVYDYLDSLIPNEKEIRGKVVAALISFWFSKLIRYKNIRSKIFLRQDIFDREVESSLTDKVKIKNYSIELKWEFDQLLNIVWKRMLEQNHLLEDFFVSHLGDRFMNREPNNSLGYIPNLSEQANRDLTDVIFGEYMGSNNKAFPYNWINYHLSDTHQHISPRTILTLFSETARLQSNDNKEYDHIVRPYNMEIAMEEVSKIRIQDLKEEFPEFEDIFNNLKEYTPQFPVEEKDLKSAISRIKNSEDKIQEIIDRLMVIGVIKSYKPKTKGSTLRYHIPDIYLIGMNLKRIGPGFHKKFIKK